MADVPSLTAAALSLEREAVTLLDRARHEAEALRLQGRQTCAEMATAAQQRRNDQTREALETRRQSLAREMDTVRGEQGKALSVIQTVRPERRQVAIDRLLTHLRERRHD